MPSLPKRPKVLKMRGKNEELGTKELYFSLFEFSRFIRIRSEEVLM